MQSRTSFFNKSIFLNTIKRFWPIWFAYAAMWLVMLPVANVGMFGYYDSSYQIERNILTLAKEGGIIMGAVFGVFAAMAAWSFVYSSRSMSGVACLPIRREGVFVSATLAGLVPMVAANALACLVTVLLQSLYGRGVGMACLEWFAIVTLSLIFFYGFATLCAQLTGNILVLPAVYVVLNFTAYVVEALVSALMNLLLYGVSSGGYGIAYYLSPIIAMFETSVQSQRLYHPETDSYEVIDVYFDGWVIFAVLALIGLVMLLGALALYRRRRMESAGDVVAVNVLKPVFKYCLTFGCALVSGCFFYYILLNYMGLAPLMDAAAITVFMLLGAFIGYFAAEMLMSKSFRVFRGRWRGFAVSVVICIVLMGALEFDLFGIERRVPDAEDVEHVGISSSDYIELSEMENIEKAIALHESIIANKHWNEAMEQSTPYTFKGSQHVYFTYVLKNGNTLQRSYNLHYYMDDESTQTDVLALEELQNSLEAIAWRKALPFEFAGDAIISGSVSSWLREDELAELGVEMNVDNYLIVEYYGYDSDYVENHMTEQEKQSLLEELYKYEDIKSIEMSRFYDYEFSAGEMYELYTECILPDLAEGKIGKLWIVNDEEYQNTVYAARIRIEMWYEYEEPREYLYAATTAASPEPHAAGTRTYTFSIVPTAESSRTTQWLLEHGVTLHTVAEQTADTGDVIDINYWKYG